VRTHRRRLLIVDAYDEREMYALAFRAAGFHVATARTMRGASRHLHSNPDAIVVGAVLADGSGAEFVARLKQTTQLATTPIILLTGFIDRARFDAMRNSGADAVVLKPCLPPDLLDHIERLWSRPPRRMRTATKT